MGTKRVEIYCVSCLHIDLSIANYPKIKLFYELVLYAYRITHIYPIKQTSLFPFNLLLYIQVWYLLLSHFHDYNMRWQLLQMWSYDIKSLDSTCKSFLY